MRGFGFFESLAAHESAALWPELSAGLLILLCAEEVFVRGRASVRQVAFAKEHVAKVANLPAHRRLSGLLSTVACLRSPRQVPTQLWRDLLTYGIELHSDGAYSAALDVFTTLIERALDEEEIRMTAMQRKAFALRLLKRFDDADVAYHHLMTVASEYGDRSMGLEAQLGLAKVLIERGNVPAAEPVVEQVLARAKGIGNRVIVAKALIDRAAIAGMRNQPDRVVQYLYEALRDIHDVPRRERAFINLCYAFRELGRHQIAQSLAMHLATSSDHLEHRLRGQIIGCNLAIDIDDRPAADALRQALATASMTPDIATEYYEVEARYHATRGHMVEALGAAMRMLATAEAASLAELTIRADAAIADIRRGLTPTIYRFRPTPAPRDTLAIVAEAESGIAQLCAR